MPTEQTPHNRKVDATVYQAIARLRREEHLGKARIRQRLQADHGVRLSASVVGMYLAQVDAEAASNGHDPRPPLNGQGHDPRPAAAEPPTGRWRPDQPPLDPHPLADLFPALSGEAGHALAADIAAHGVREAIWLYQGQILDGRNRYNICRALVIACPTRDYTGDDPLGFVVSMNLHRRHLTESQRALVAARLATMRQGERTDLEPSENSPKVSQAKAAELLNISDFSLRAAKTVRAEAQPEVIRAVETGTMAVSAAAKLAKLPVGVQREVVRQLEAGEATTVTAALQHTSACVLAAPSPRRRAHHRMPPLEPTRRWYILLAGVQQVIADFAHGGGLEPLLQVWTPEERTRAREELRRQRDQLDRLDAALSAADRPEEAAEPPAAAQP
jgi:hypothetical protein